MKTIPLSKNHQNEYNNTNMWQVLDEWQPEKRPTGSSSSYCDLERKWIRTLDINLF